MSATPHDLFAFLDDIGVAYATTWHRPVFTVDEGRDLKEKMPGLHTKNLFLKDKKGAFYLLCAHCDSKIDLNATSKAIGAGRFSFGSADLLLEILGVTPGSVTVFALLNDRAQRAALLLDEALLRAEPVHFHPLTNEATTAVSREGLMKFLTALDRRPRRLRFDTEGAPSVIE